MEACSWTDATVAEALGAPGLPVTGCTKGEALRHVHPGRGASVVGLREEGLDVWRPVKVRHMGENVHRIMPQQPHPADENWAFNITTFGSAPCGRSTPANI